MKFSIELFVSIFVLSVGIANAKELPSYLELCKRNLPKQQLTECMLKNIEILRPKLPQGIPDLFVPSISPLKIPKACLKNGNFQACFNDLEFYHGENFAVKDLSVDLDKYDLDLKLHFPLLRIKSIYDINGKILILELNGKGPADGNYTNVDLNLKFQGKSEKKKGKEYISFEKESVELSIESATVLFENIFGNNQELTDQANKIINDNIKDIIDELKPVIGEIISKFVTSIIENVFDRYSISELFPNS